MYRQTAKFRPHRLTSVFCVTAALVTAALLPARAIAQEISSTPTQPPYIEPRQLSPAEMSQGDATLVRAKQKEITREAAFFGYDLSAGQWSWDQVLCPEMPDELLLHYRSESRNGAVSLFTALVPREQGRVLIVPVLYRNGMPFHSAVDSDRTIAVFNRAVPAAVAAQAVEPDGHWLALAICYAEVAGAEPRVPQRADADPALVQAPLPTLHLSEESPTREIVFSDRDAPGGYLVWTITVDRRGRVLSASAKSLSNYVAKVRGGAEPKEKIVSPGPEPKEKPMPAGTREPVEKPDPQ